MDNMDNIAESEFGVNANKEAEVEHEIIINQKGSITAMYGNGMQIVFNTMWSKEEFEARAPLHTDDGDYLMVPIDETNIRVLNLRHIFFLDYGPIADMEALREELKRKQEEARAAQNSSIIRPGKHSPVGTRGRMQ